MFSPAERPSTGQARLSREETVRQDSAVRPGTRTLHPVLQSDNHYWLLEGKPPVQTPVSRWTQRTLLPLIGSHVRVSTLGGEKSTYTNISCFNRSQKVWQMYPSEHLLLTSVFFSYEPWNFSIRCFVTAESETGNLKIKQPKLNKHCADVGVVSLAFNRTTLDCLLMRFINWLLTELFMRWQFFIVPSLGLNGRAESLVFNTAHSQQPW